MRLSYSTRQIGGKKEEMLKLIEIETGPSERAQWVRTLAGQAGGPEFQYPVPTLKANSSPRKSNKRVAGVLCPPGQQTVCSKFSNRFWLKGVR